VYTRDLDDGVQVNDLQGRLSRDTVHERRGKQTIVQVGLADGHVAKMVSTP